MLFAFLMTIVIGFILLMHPARPSLFVSSLIMTYFAITWTVVLAKS